MKMIRLKNKHPCVSKYPPQFRERARTMKLKLVIQISVTAILFRCGEAQECFEIGRAHLSPFQRKMSNVLHVSFSCQVFAREPYLVPPPVRKDILNSLFFVYKIEIISQKSPRMIA